MSSKNNTYINETMKILKERGYITSWDAITEMGNTRLSATIFELRHKYDMPIEMEMRTAKNGKRYGYYFLVQKEA